MTAPRDAKSDIHPLVRPITGLTSPRAGLITVIVLAVLVVAGFGLETVLSEDGLSKYPEVYGAYELLPLAAGAVAILAGWALVWLLSRPGDFYSRAAGDVKEGEND
ncbi:hypothetical protein [Oceanicaulis sp.]|jgi:hypothetical protein|uniref:hypothetical protein n=1 Tax=Oceanicaulis sp. TaxID=1924941 RepID=UPI003F7308A1